MRAPAVFFSPVPILLLLCSLAFSCARYEPFKRVTLPTGDATNEISVPLSSEGEQGAPVSVFVRNNSVWICESGTSDVKVFDLKARFKRDLRPSIGARSPDIADMLVDDRSRLYLVERGLEETGLSNQPVRESLILHVFSPDGRYVKTIASFDGLLRGMSVNSYGQLTTVVEYPDAGWTARRFIDDIPVKTVRLTNSLTRSNAFVINNVCPFDNDNKLLIERIPVPSDQRALASYSVYDMLTGKEEPAAFVPARMLRGGYFLYGSSGKADFYFMKHAKRNSLSVLKLSSATWALSKKNWDMSFKNSDGLLLEPRIDRDANVYQTRLGPGYIRLVFYR